MQLELYIYIYNPKEWTCDSMGIRSHFNHWSYRFKPNPGLPQNEMHTFFDSSDINIVFRSVPIIILSFANSSWVAVSFSAPSTAALMAAILTKFARSGKEENQGKLIGRTLIYFIRKNQKQLFNRYFTNLQKELLFNRMKRNSPAPLNPGVPRAIALTSTSSDNGLSCR